MPATFRVPVLKAPNLVRAEMTTSSPRARPKYSAVSFGSEMPLPAAANASQLPSRKRSWPRMPPSAAGSMPVNSSRLEMPL